MALGSETTERAPENAVARTTGSAENGASVRRLPRAGHHVEMGADVTPGPPWLVVVTGWTCAGKSTIADLIARELDATVASFDWLMSGLRVVPEVWATVELPIERQRRVGWNLMPGSQSNNCVEAHRACSTLSLARSFVGSGKRGRALRCEVRAVECVCADIELHGSRVEGRRREIPGWYELDWERVARGREAYEPLAEPKLVLEAADSADDNLDKVRRTLLGQHM